MLLDEGKAVDLHDYVQKCRTFSIKTFYYFCERLSQDSVNVIQPSSDLRNHILVQVEAAGINVSKDFNPEGWFGYDWTKQTDGYGFFREEYCEILERSRRNPYWYQIKPEYFELIRQLIHTDQTQKAVDISEPQSPSRHELNTYRILRDTALARRVKELHNYECQICGLTLDLGNGKWYAESHHLKPLGKPHDGPDVEQNIICVCPNHHALLDYGAITIDKSRLFGLHVHNVGDDYIVYHNQVIYTGSETK